MDIEEKILSSLNPSQKEAVLYTDSPLLILAGAGSGKTRTIVHKVAYLIEKTKLRPSSILALTFTNKATQEMLERIHHFVGEKAYYTHIRTYHSFGLGILREFAEKIHYPSSFSIWDEEDSLKILQEINQKKGFKLSKTQIKYIRQRISSFKDQLLRPEEILSIEEQEEVDIYLPSFYKEYEEIKEKSKALDFDDFIFRLVLLLEEDKEFWDKISSRFHYILVDEYQDTNYSQYKLISLLAKRHYQISVVGDDDQAIYSWRGASVEHMFRFQEEFQAKIIKLEENYRSTPQILEIANAVIQNNQNRYPKVLYTKNPPGENPKILFFSNSREEATWVIQEIKRLLEKESLSLHDIAILYRTNAQSRLFEEELVKNQLPYIVYGNVSFFERKEIKDILAYLRFLVNPEDELSFKRFINHPPRGIGKKSQEKILSFREKLGKEGVLPSFFTLWDHIEEMDLPPKAKDSLDKLFEKLYNWHRKVYEVMDLERFVREILEESGLFAFYEEEDRLLGTSRLENIQSFLSSLKEFQETYPKANLALYLQEMSLFSSWDERWKTKEKIQLMSIHMAKGVEFSAVFVVGLNEDLFPHYLSKKEERIEEERRLFYVAITRAKKFLYLSSFQKEALREFLPSRFLYEIPGVYAPQEEKKWEDFRKGDRIYHEVFGRGKILALEGKGEKQKAHVLFENRGVKTLLIHQAPVKKIEEDI